MKRLILSLGIASLIAISQSPAMAEAVTGAGAPVTFAAKRLPAITVAEVQPMLLSDRVIVSGLVAAVEEVQVVPLIEGQPVEELLVDVGDWVEEGQVLARLSSSTLELQKTEALASLASAKAAIAQGEAQLVEAEAGAAEAERVITRTTLLKEKGTASQATWDAANAAKIAADARVSVATEGLEAARAQLALAEARLKTAELYLGRTEVKAPVAGVVVARNAKLGAIASAAGQPLFVITRDGALELRADVAEADVLRLTTGMTVKLQAVGMTEPLAGTVRLIEPSIDPVTRLGQARISVDVSGGLRAGMFAEAEILLTEREGLAVPVTALGRTDGETTVMRVRDGVVEVAPVTLGIRDGAMVEVTKGLAPGDLVVVKAGAFVRQGDRINPVLAE